MHHIHLPMLDDEGLCAYDPASRSVTYDSEKLSRTWIDEN
jgi:hypothetical protein